MERPPNITPRPTLTNRGWGTLRLPVLLPNLSKWYCLPWPAMSRTNKICPGHPSKGGSALRFSFPAPPVSDSCLPTRHPNLSNPRPFNVLPSRSNDTKKVIDTHCTFVLFFLVFTCTKLRSAGSYPRCFEHPTKDAHPESANGGGAEGFFSATRPPQFLTRAPVPLSHRFPCPITLLPCTPNRCRINTCKSLSKQTALTLIESHSYKKHRGEGVLWLTSHGI